VIWKPQREGLDLLGLKECVGTYNASTPSLRRIPNPHQIIGFDIIPQYNDYVQGLGPLCMFV